MRVTRPVRRRTTGRSRCLFWLGLTVPLVFPGLTLAAPAAAGMLALGVVGQAASGTIKGHLVWGDDNIPPAKVLIEKGKSEKNPDICAKDEPILSRDLVIDPKSKGVAYGFAYLVKPKGNFAEAVKALLAKEPKVVLDQKACEFQPYVLPFHKDQALVIKSSDPTNHNVRFAGFSNAGINQMVAPMGQLEVKLDPDRFPLELHCDIHPWMKGYLMVFDHPFFTTTGSDGAFEIKGVPAGQQNLVVWHGKFITQGLARGMPVMIKAGEVSDVGLIKIDPAK
jgi:hypothetical protein